MADLYPPSYTGRSATSSSNYQRDSQPYPMANNPQYPPQLISSNSSSNGSSESVHDQAKQQPDPAAHKQDTKPQATFLTKLYALLERTENHHMIRWDPAGEHIIVERPEQLALHVLPSIYRQSRFASFSRQLNIYGFMRKVNLRNVDPAIDDPDASTWSHPTLNRHSPPEVVANFKRRVPPRLPKPRKRDQQESLSIPPPRAPNMGNPLSVPSSKMSPTGRSRGFSAPGSFTPMNQGAWGPGYPRSGSGLPPLNVPSDPPHLSHSMYGHSSHHIHPITPTDDVPPGNYPSISYPHSSRDMVNPSGYGTYQDQQSWGFNGSNSHSGSLSSLLNPSSSGYQRPSPTINTSYNASPFSALPLDHNGSSLSPDSRPTTGYSMSSVSSLPYDDNSSPHPMYDSRPNSSHHRPGSPTRPRSGYGPNNNTSSLSVRRTRRHSQAMSPYPSPYDHQRPSTSPQPNEDHNGQSAGGGPQRVRSMIQLPSVDPYSFTPGQAEFAYNAAPGPGNGSGHLDNGYGGGYSRSVRPSTASSMASSSANTPPVQENYNGETDINRFSPDFGFVPMNEHITQQFAKTPNDA